MPLTRADVVAYLDRLSTSELAALIDELQARLGMRPPPPPPVRIVMGMSLDPVPAEQTEFTVFLRSFGADKIAVIKALREVLPLGIKAAKDLVESAPVALREDLPRDEARALAERLRRAGADVDVR